MSTSARPGAPKAGRGAVAVGGAATDQRAGGRAAPRRWQRLRVGRSALLSAGERRTALRRPGRLADARLVLRGDDGPRPRPPVQLLLLALVSVLCVLGLVMVLSASSVHALRQYGTSWLFFQRQLMWTAIGAGVLAFAAAVDYHLWRRLVVPFLALVVFLLCLVLVPGVGTRVAGSTRWLNFGPIGMQPSEVAKLALLFYCADLLARRADRMHEWRVTVRPVVLVAGGVAALILLQPDMGTMLSLGCIVVAVLFVAGVPMRVMAALVGVAAVGSLVLGYLAPYRRARLLSFLDPFADAEGSGFQGVQSLVGLGSGAFTGLGLGQSRAKWGFLPNAHTDFVFAIVGEELGLIGSLLVVGLFVAFAVVGTGVAVRAPDRFGSLLAAGITAWVVGQGFINMGAVTGILPITGVPLPFVSFGGSSLVILMAASGILLNVAGQARPLPPRPET